MRVPLCLLALLVPAAASQPASKAITGPVLSRKPTAEQIGAYYPKAAMQQYVAGRVKLDCRVTIDGYAMCHAVEETPPGLGFADTAVSKDSQ